MWCIRSRWISATSRGRPSLLASDVLRCVDGAQVLRVGATTQLPFTEADLECFLGRLKELRKMPISGGDLRAFLSKVEEALPKLGPDAAHLALTIFAELRCRQALYRCVYGLARLHTGRGSSHLLRAAQSCALKALQRRPCELMPKQLVRFCWSLARLGCRENALFEAFEVRLREVLDKLQYKELEALYNILTELERVNQWKLIHDVERAMESRGVDDTTKRTRKKPFRRRWTRADLMHTVVHK
eukprot:symbB.v1.2.014346.t1/scaffold1047.1/size141927/12